MVEPVGEFELALFRKRMKEVKQTPDIMFTILVVNELFQLRQKIRKLNKQLEKFNER